MRRVGAPTAVVLDSLFPTGRHAAALKARAAETASASAKPARHRSASHEFVEAKALLMLLSLRPRRPHAAESHTGHGKMIGKEGILSAECSWKRRKECLMTLTTATSAAATAAHVFGEKSVEHLERILELEAKPGRWEAASARWMLRVGEGRVDWIRMHAIEALSRGRAGSSGVVS